MIQYSDQRIQPRYCPDYVIYKGAPKLSSVVCKTRTAVEPLLIKSLYHFIGMRQREPFHIPWIIPLTSAVKCIYHLFILMLYLILSLGNEHAGFANFIDEWSQCDFCFTNFGVILEYLESSIRLSSAWSRHVYTIVTDKRSSCGGTGSPSSKYEHRHCCVTFKI